MRDEIYHKTCTTIESQCKKAVNSVKEMSWQGVGEMQISSTRIECSVPAAFIKVTRTLAVLRSVMTRSWNSIQTQEGLK